jgi:short subunit dehydrogenase-like uncharacterized protein
MPLLSRQTGPITVYGATGYTGRLVAAELAEAEADFVISGRSLEKLEALANELGADVPVKPATLDDPASLRSVFADSAVVIDCAGPFTRYGEPVLRAAVETSTHYLDTTGEQSYMKMAFERYGPGAAEAEVAVIPAMGFDYVPGDMIASLTATGLGELEELTMAYAWLGFRATRGTMLSTLEVIKGGSWEWRNMEWQQAPLSISAGTFEFPEPFGRHPMIRYPSGEQITVPRHVPTRNVRTMMNATMLAPSKPLARVARPLAAPAGLAMRTPIKRLAETAISRLPEGPSEKDRMRSRFMIVCDARRGEELRRGIVTGSDVYGLTAALAVKGAIIASSTGFSGSGALAPSQAFDPTDFLDGFERFAVRWDLEGVPQPVEAGAAAS